MAAEQGGGAKSAEGIGWLAGYLRAQRHNVGTARVRFGMPLSLRQALEDAGEGSAQLEKVAFRIMVGINRATPVTATALVTFALLSVRDRALTLEQVREVIAPLLDHLDAREIPGPAADLRDPSAVNDTLAWLVDGGVVSVYADGAEPVWSIAPDHHHVAAFYRNGMLHHVLNRAVMELVMLDLATSPPEGDGTRRGMGEGAGAARPPEVRLLLLAQGPLRRADRRRGAAGSAGTARTTRTRRASGWPRAPVLLAHGVLRPFIDAQFVVATCLAARGDKPLARQRPVHARVPRARPPAAAAGARPRRRLGLARAVRHGAAARRQPRARRRRRGGPRRSGSTSWSRTATCSRGSRRSTPRDWRRCWMSTLDELLDAIAAAPRARRSRRSSTTTGR